MVNLYCFILPLLLGYAKSNTPLFVATPSSVTVGLTETFDLRCSVDKPSGNISKLVSIHLSLVHNGVDQLLASIDPVFGAVVKPGVEGATVIGSVDVGTEDFIELLWKYPGRDQEGEYVCDVSAIDVSSNAMILSSSVTVTSLDAPLNLVVQKLKKVQQDRDELSTKVTDTTNALTDALHTINDLNVTQCGTRTVKNCNDLAGSEPGSYVVIADPQDGSAGFSVRCHITDKNVAWTVFQDRHDGSVDFQRSFQEYKDGFGDPETEHWLGLENMRRLLVQASSTAELEVDMVTPAGNHYSRNYPEFNIGAGDTYTLTARGLNDSDRGLSVNSGSEFSTLDHGQWSTFCVVNNRLGGWWFPAGCGFTNLNGVYDAHGTSSIHWYEVTDDYSALTSTTLKFRIS